jgi:hypothetical protein
MDSVSDSLIPKGNYTTAYVPVELISRETAQCSIIKVSINSPRGDLPRNYREKYHRCYYNAAYYRDVHLDISRDAAIA